MARAEAKYVISAKDKTRAATNSAKRNLQGLGATAKSALGPLIAIAGVAGLVALGKNALAAADQVHKLSIRLGASAEALSQYQYVSEVTGVSFKTMAMGWQRMTRRISEAAVDMGEARGALKELGLEAKELNRLAPEEQFEELADAIAKVENPADQVRLAMKLFDSEGVALIQMMKDGKAGLQAYREEAERLGLTLTQEQVEKAAAAKDAMTRLKKSMGAVVKEIVVALGPAIAEIANWLAYRIPVAVEWAAQAFTDMRVWVLGALIDMLEGISNVAKALSSLGGGLGLGFAAAGFAIDALNRRLEETKEGLKTGREQFEKFKLETDDATAAVKRMAGTIMNDLVYALGYLGPEFEKAFAEYNRLQKLAEKAGAAMENAIASGAEGFANAIFNAVEKSKGFLESLADVAKSVFRLLFSTLFRVGLGWVIGGPVGAAIGGLKSAPAGSGGPSIPPPDKAGGITVIINSNGDIFTDPLVKRRVAEELGDEITRAQLAIGPA